MMKLKLMTFAALLAFSAAVFADEEPTPPDDGPVYSPPGWVCSASGGVVTCVKIPDSRKEK